MSTRRTLLLALGVAVLAFLVRAVPVLAAGGLLGRGDYDDVVYYSAADALLHGRLPYRDFLFLQPPGVLVLLAPFAAIGSALGDPVGLAVARLAFFALGGLNAALAVLVLRRAGMLAAVVGGVFLAGFFPAAFAERLTLLEPIGTTALLGGLLALGLVARSQSAVTGAAESAERRSRRATVVLCVAAGALVGLSITTKLWGVLPAAILLGAVLLRDRRIRPRALPFVLGVAGAGLVVVGPALALDPSAFWRQVVTDQLGRPRVSSEGVSRLFWVLKPPESEGAVGDTLVVLLLLVLAVLAVAAWRVPGARIAVVLLVVILVFLLAAPSFYRHYGSFAAGPIALVVGIGVPELARTAGRMRLRAARPVLAVALVVVGAWCASGWVLEEIGEYVTKPPPAALLAAVRQVDGCVQTDDPAVPILAGVLTEQLRRGCPFEPDFTGHVYDGLGRTASGAAVPADESPAFQRYGYAYLTSGDAAVLARRSNGLSDATEALFSRVRAFGVYRLALPPFAPGP